jgi:hypothetical protein
VYTCKEEITVRALLENISGIKKEPRCFPLRNGSQIYGTLLSAARAALPLLHLEILYRAVERKLNL